MGRGKHGSATAGSADWRAMVEATAMTLHTPITAAHASLQYHPGHAGSLAFVNFQVFQAAVAEANEADEQFRRMVVQGDFDAAAQEALEALRRGDVTDM
jgi:hypothetical protein